jgi:hypothetical protein
MRSDFIAYINSLQLGTYRVSEELPWSNNGQALYLSNLKRIYIDADQIEQRALIDTLGSAGAVDEITTVRVYFANDAKNLPSNYESLVGLIKLARTQDFTLGYIEKLCQVSTDYESDRMITEFDFSFRKLMTN